jgi:hypothetical protein
VDSPRSLVTAVRRARASPTLPGKTTYCTTKRQGHVRHYQQNHGGIEPCRP